MTEMEILEGGAGVKGLATAFHMLSFETKRCRLRSEAYQKIWREKIYAQ